jgi:hypothetical protein
MIKQICYVLASTGTDLYAQMTCISLSLSRRLYPAAKIVVLVDEVTQANLTKCQSPLLSLASQIISVETGMPAAVARNRFIKTSMRQVLSGDFVFLDADALPIRKFDELAQTGAGLAAALDLEEFFDRPHVPTFALEGLHYGPKHGHLWSQMRGLAAGFDACLRQWRSRHPVSLETYRLYRRLTRCSRLPISELPTINPIPE